MGLFHPIVDEILKQAAALPPEAQAAMDRRIARGTPGHYSMDPAVRARLTGKPPASAPAEKPAPAKAKVRPAAAAKAAPARSPAPASVPAAVPEAPPAVPAETPEAVDLVAARSAEPSADVRFTGGTPNISKNTLWHAMGFGAMPIPFPIATRTPAGQPARVVSPSAGVPGVQIYGQGPATLLEFLRWLIPQGAPPDLPARYSQVPGPPIV